MKWISLKKEKPPPDTPILVFRHGWDITHTRHWQHIEIAEYVLPPRYKKRMVFGMNITRGRETGKVRDGFPLDNVTHWMLLPEPPPRLHNDNSAPV